ncbi:ABC transporter permease [Baileyella intestinalis]|uniref:ABC transporter permease n=1 Tax=Baileyella intestinalis TaxID=2606709 RepID=UPI003A83BF7B
MKYSKAWASPFLIWIAIGTVVPVFSIAYYGFSNRAGHFTFDNIGATFSPDHMEALGLSLLLAFVSTAICFILALPMAMILSNSRHGKTGMVIFIFILPMWMNFLLRTMAWQVLLEREGVINSIFHAVGLPGQHLINTPAAIVLGMVYDFLPFMILPIYNAACKIDNRLIEAAYDLGADKGTVYRKVIFPLLVPGIVSGVTMVFIPALTTFVISNMLGGGKINLIGNIIEQEFTVSSNWYLGSGMSLVMMVFIIITMLLFGKFDKSGGESLI